MWQGWRNVALPGAGFTPGVLKKQVGVLAVIITAVQPGVCYCALGINLQQETLSAVMVSYLRCLLVHVSLIVNFSVGSKAVRTARISFMKLLLKFVKVFHGSR
jgi:hypothetical protein